MVIFTERNDADRFRHALEKIEDGHREIRELSEKMRSQYGERGTMGDRDGDGRYHERDHYDERGYYGERYGERDGYGHREGGYYGERRDSMGRYRD